MVLAICILIILIFTVFFPIKNINVKGSKVYDSNQILAVCGIEKGDNLLAVSGKKTLSRIKKKLPYVDSVELKITMPDTINITVKDADKYACFKVEDDYYIVSKSGWVMEKVTEKPENLFEIRGADVKCSVACQTEYKNDEDKELIEKLISLFTSDNIDIDYFDISDTLNYKFGAEDRFEVQLGSSNYLEEKVKHFAKMVDNIPEKDKGDINLTMWTPENPTATFVKEKTEN